MMCVCQTHDCIKDYHSMSSGTLLKTVPLRIVAFCFIYVSFTPQQTRLNKYIRFTYITHFQKYIQCSRACATWGLLAVSLTGIWQQGLWKTNCKEPDESSGQYRLTPPLCAKSGHKQLPFPLSHPVEVFSDLSTHTHTHTHTHLTHMNSDSCLITCPYTRIHALPPPDTHAHRPPWKIPTHATTCILGSGPATTSTHSSANESISWFHSFHCCQTPSISPFSARPNRAAGELRDGEEREGAWNIPAVQRLLISYPLWFPRNMVFWWCVAVCTCEVKEREEIKKRSRRQDVFSQSLYMVSDLRFTSARLAV